AGETGNGYILAGFQIQTVEVFHAPQDVAFGDGAYIFAVSLQNGDGGKALIGPFFQGLAQGKILVNVQYVLFGRQKEQKIHAVVHSFWWWCCLYNKYIRSACKLCEWIVKKQPLRFLLKK